MIQLLDYAIQCRRYLHMHPEIGFDLPITTAFVKKELQAMGLTSTDRYGTCSVVTEIGPAGTPILAFRADMDAVPVEEKTNLPFASLHPGKMHACGHDSHTAILLAVAKHLKQRETELPCRVRLMFQPSEECAQSGGEMMVENGVMNDVFAVVASHCENTLETGCVGICPGDYMAACAPITVEFFGKTSHAAIPKGGVDAVAMAHQAYTEMKKTVAGLAGDRPFVWSVGTFQGGTAHNVIADHCKMDISFRFFDYEFAEQVRQAVEQIGHGVAREHGGSFKLNWLISTGAVHNDRELTEVFKRLMTDRGFAVKHMPSRMTSEDFGWYLTKTPGMLFRFGTGTLGCGTAHQNDFEIDEAGIAAAIHAFTILALNSDQLKTEFKAQPGNSCLD